MTCEIHREMHVFHPSASEFSNPVQCDVYMHLNGCAVSPSFTPDTDRSWCLVRNPLRAPYLKDSEQQIDSLFATVPYIIYSKHRCYRVSVFLCIFFLHYRLLKVLL